MRVQGSITKWDDDRGFGFITPASGGRDIFLHIKSLNNKSGRPAIGAKVTYQPGSDERGRPCANYVELLNRPTGASAPSKALYVVAAFFVLLGFTFLLGFIPQTILWFYGVFSVFTFILYAWDKSAARHGSQRTAENTLHLFALLGGWPGALYAQQRLRHKSSKQSFRFMFWITVILNSVILAYMISEQGTWLAVSLEKLASQGLGIVRDLF